MRGARLLTLLGGKRRYNTSTFANWTPVVGAAADGVASALADWGLNLVVNGEFTEDTAGWSANAGDITRHDSSVTPGVASPGADPYCLGVVSTNVNTSASRSGTSVAGARYNLSALTFLPDTYISSSGARFGFAGGTPSSMDFARLLGEWQYKEVVGVLASGSQFIFYLFNRSEEEGDAVYFDAVQCYLQTTPLLSPHRAASGVWTWAITQPASDVVPWSALVRYVDPLNYWEVRTKPNTDGNDLELVEVVAGVETVRAAADVDWTAGETDELRITARGTTIGVEHRKHGETTWTAGLSYASATAHHTASRYGQMQWGIGEKRAASVRWNK